MHHSTPDYAHRHPNIVTHMFAGSTGLPVACCRMRFVDGRWHVSNWYPNHRTGPPWSPGDREIVGRRQRISKGVSWRDVQPEWCMMRLLAPSCTALALTVRRASPRQERYASCVKLSPDFTVAGGPGRPGPSCQRVGRRTGLTISSRGRLGRALG